MGYFIFWSLLMAALGGALVNLYYANLRERERQARIQAALGNCDKIIANIKRTLDKVRSDLGGT